MYDEKTLRWLEPFGGWGDHSQYYVAGNKKIMINNDTGLCNRIFHWELAYFITEKHGYNFKIYLQHKFYPEITLLDFPETIPIYFKKYDFHFIHGNNFENLFFKTVFDLKNDQVKLSDKIDLKSLNYLITDEDYRLNISGGSHYYSDFGYKSLEDIFKNNKKSFDSKNRPLTKIKLKHTFVEETIKNYVKGYVGIHLRRNNGVNITNKDLSKMEEPIRKKYENLQKNKNVVGNYTFYGDDLYFSLIEKILEINPKQRFYISDDLPEGFINYYQKKYGYDVIKTRDEIAYDILSFYYSCGIDVLFLENYGNLINNIIDLFALSYCSFLVMSPKSTWSEFARDYKNQPSEYITADTEDIILKYKQKHIKSVI